MANALGIDLGTTMSAMAVVDETGGTAMVKNRRGDVLTPSVVQFKGDKWKVGVSAKQARLAQPHNTASFVKRNMSDPDWVFIDEGNREHSPEEVASIILHHLKEDAKQALGKSIDRAVITVPAYFRDLERNRTRIAGEMAGFEVLRLINEPTAAAIAYGLDHLEEHSHVLVYDWGGGTFDVTIMELRGQDIQVIATGGDSRLGGADFDNLLAEHLQELFQEEHGIDPLEDMRDYQHVMDVAEDAKEQLAFDDEVDVALQAQGRTLNTSITRETFEKLIGHLVDRTEDMTTQTLEEASLDWAAIDKILLVGGSTRIPLVRERMKALSGKEPELAIDPDEVVARGAAIVAAMEVGETPRTTKGEAISKARIRDVTSHSLGIIAVDKSTGKEYNSTIIPKNTPIPAKKTCEYTTIKDNQTGVYMPVLEGEDKDPAYCTILDDNVALEGIPPQPEGIPRIIVTMQYDEEQIVHVHAIEESSGRELNVRIHRDAVLSQEEQERIKSKLSEVSKTD